MEDLGRDLLALRDWCARTGVAQLRALVVTECGLDPARLTPILHYDGTPITARFIFDAIGRQWRALSGVPHRDAAE